MERSRRTADDRADAAQCDNIDRAERALDQLALDDLDPDCIDSKPLVTDDQRQGDRFEPEHLRPLAGDHRDQFIEAPGIERGDHRFVDRHDRARMATSKGEQIGARGLGRAKPLAHCRDRRLFELDYAPHAPDDAMARLI